MISCALQVWITFLGGCTNRHCSLVWLCGKSFTYNTDCTPKIKLSDTASPLQRWVDLSAGACGNITLKEAATLIKIPADSWQARWSHIAQEQGLISRVFKDCAGRESGLLIFWVKPNCLFFSLKIAVCLMFPEYTLQDRCLCCAWYYPQRHHQ